MGTKIQANAFLRDYHPVIDLDERPLYHENQIVKNPNSFTTLIHKNGYLGYDTDKVRQTILEHESIFRNQLQELHRLYKRQRQLMSEIKRGEIAKDGSKQDISKSSPLSYLSNKEKIKHERFSKLPVFENTSQNRNFQGPYDRDANLRFGSHLKNTNNQSYLSLSNQTDGVPTNSCSNFNLVTKDFMQDFCSGKTPVEPRNENLNCPLDLGARRKRKIFGVEIFEGNDDTLEATNISTEVGKYERPNVNSFFDHTDMSGKWIKGCSSRGLNIVKMPYRSSESQTKQDNPMGGLPWFLKNSQYSRESSNNGTKGSYFMNMDSLQNRSEDFFSKQKKEISPIVDDNTSGKKILGIPISDMLKDLNSGDDFTKTNTSNIEVNNSRTVETDEDSQKGLNNYISDLRHHIDLNLTLNEEDDVTLTPSVPTAILKIATTEIDLEASAVIEHETDVLTKEVNSTVSLSDKIAAEAIIAISLSRDNNFVYEPQDSISTDRLKWLAEIVSSSFHDKEEFVPNGMDYFEFMTLQLEDTKEKNYLYKPVILHSRSDDEAGSRKLPKRSRRGRQRKDFQRDILPGLVTLSRHEVTEDFQAFEEMLKADGSIGQSSVRNCRGRKRTKTKAHSLIRKQKPVCQHDERSLSGWGKRTRRLPRQRCTNSFISFPVKC